VDACREEFDRAARSFGLIPAILPPTDRERVALLYCFCRRLDDAVDETPDSTSARAALDAVAGELEGRTSPRPLVSAFLVAAAEGGVPLECTRFLLEGMRNDLDRVQVADDDDLIRYCYRVSAAVGLMLCPLLGIRAPDALRRAVDLGIALQISNILLGVASDAGRDRVYLPATRLFAHGLSGETVRSAPTSPALRPVLAELATLADRYYRSAIAGTRLTPLRYRHGILLLARVYRAMGHAAARDPGAPGTPDRLPLRTRLFRLGEIAFLALTPAILGLTPMPPHDPALHRAIAGWPGTDQTRG
jgi:phytoene synthase